MMSDVCLSVTIIIAEKFRNGHDWKLRPKFCTKTNLVLAQIQFQKQPKTNIVNIVIYLRNGIVKVWIQIYYSAEKQLS